MTTKRQTLGKRTLIKPKRDPQYIHAKCGGRTKQSVAVGASARQDRRTKAGKMPFSQSDICPLKNDRGEVTGGSGGRTNMGNKAIMNDFSAPQLRLCPLGNKDKAEALYKDISTYKLQ